MATVEQQQNPLTEGLERMPVHPTTLVIFGGTGDLAKRKLLPAIYNLAHEGALPERFNLIAVSRSDIPHDDYRDMARECIKEFSRRQARREGARAAARQRALRARHLRRRHDVRAPEGVPERVRRGAGIVFNRVFYLSTSPRFFPVIVGKLGEHELQEHDEAEVRVVIEKPIGRNLAEASELNKAVLSVLREEQVFRIDHYLGKETVQNMMALRFANGLFEPIWNRNFIDFVQITAAEDLGVGTRAGYYDTLGRAARPGAEPHAPAARAALHGAAGDVLRRRRARREGEGPPRDPSADGGGGAADGGACAVRARAWWGASRCPATSRRRACRPTRRTETYAALRLEVDNWRWAGVPIYLRTGKRLARKITEIAVTLKPVPHLAFDQQGSVGVQPNQLIMTMQPNEGVAISLGAKIPGSRMRIRPVNMEFLYGTAFLSQSPEAYERLIMDAMRGDATLFTRDDEVEAQWRIIDPILQAWAQDDSPLPQYPAGSQRAGGGERHPRRRAPVADDLSGRAAPSWTVSGPRRTRHRPTSRPRSQELLKQRHDEDTAYRARAGAQPRGDRRPRVAGRDPESAGASGPVLPLAAHPLLGGARADTARCAGHHEGGG